MAMRALGFEPKKAAELRMERVCFVGSSLGSPGWTHQNIQSLGVSYCHDDGESKGTHPSPNATTCPGNKGLVTVC